MKQQYFLKRTYDIDYYIMASKWTVDLSYYYIKLFLKILSREVDSNWWCYK